MVALGLLGRSGTIAASIMRALVLGVAIVADAAWYDGIKSVQVFTPADDVGTAAWNLYSRMKTAQFSSERHALLLTSGDYQGAEIAVGYYTSLIGVGQDPDAVTVASFYTLDNPDVGNACVNFWRSAEGLRASNPNITWAASQAAPLRRVHVDHDLWLSERGPPHWSSGGFMSASTIQGPLHMGTQQQYLVRNSLLQQGAVGKAMNYVYVGVDGAPANSSDGRVSTLARTPLIAEKPYLVEANGQWSICLPHLLHDVAGVGKTTVCATQIDVDADVFVAKEGDSAATINAAIAGKRALLLTPALYDLDGPIIIGDPDFVVLGIGFPTLLATSGRSALVVNTSATNARVAGVLLEAATDVSAAPTDPLMLWAGDGGVGSDLFARVGALKYSTPQKPSCLKTRADTHLRVEGSSVVLDNTWFWHADHDDCGGASDQAYSAHGLEVMGDDVTAYGLKSEHTFEDLVSWKGERGRTFMFQSELPYNDLRFGGFGYHVVQSVREHQALGMGVYIIGELTVKAGIQLPLGSTAANLFSWVIGRSVKQFASVVCVGTGSKQTCYGGDTCDYSSCYQLGLPPPAGRTTILQLNLT